MVLTRPFWVGSLFYWSLHSYFTTPIGNEWSQNVSTCTIEINFCMCVVRAEVGRAWESLVLRPTPTLRFGRATLCALGVPHAHCTTVLDIIPRTESSIFSRLN
jgi:hypothetical protein